MSPRVHAFDLGASSLKHSPAPGEPVNTSKHGDATAPDEIIPKLVSLARASSGCDGVAVAVCGLVDTESGEVRHAVNLEWDNVALAERIEAELEVPVAVLNDADAAALGVWSWLISHWEARRALTLTQGSGLGGGLVDGGELVTDAKGSGIEPGHALFQRGDKLVRGDLVGGMRGLEFILEREGLEMPESGGRELEDMARDGDEAVLHALADWGELFAPVLVNCACLTACDWIVLTGGLSNLYDFYGTALEQETARMLPQAIGQGLKITVNPDPDLALEGAREFFFSQEL